MSLPHSIPTNGHFTQVITGVLALEQPATNSKWNVGAMLLDTVGIVLRLQDQFQFTGTLWQDTQALLLMHDESSSTSMHEESPPTSVHDRSPREISVEDGAQEDSKGQLETPSEAKIQSDAKELDEYKKFAVAFKSYRLKMGYSYADVMQQVAIRYNKCISQEIINHFEGLQLTTTVVQKLKTTLERWVRDTAKASGTSEEEIKIVSPTTSINPKRERKRRSSVDAGIFDQLEAEFQRKCKPNKVEMG